MAAKTEVKEEKSAGFKWEPVKDGGKPKDPGEIEHDINSTRYEMDRTMDAIGEKFHPRHVVDEFMDFFKPEAESSREALSDTGRRIGSLVRDNPLPATLIGAGLGLFIIENTGGRQLSEEQKEELMAKGGRISRAMRERISETATGAKETIREKAEGISEEFQKRTKESPETLSKAMSAAGENVNEMGRTLKTQYDQSVEGAKKFAHDNPLGVGLAALAFGMLAGLLIPETVYEKRAVGEKTEELKEQTDKTRKSELPGTGEPLDAD